MATIRRIFHDRKSHTLRHQVMRILADMIQKAYKSGQAVSHIVLACTELPMLFKSAAGELIKDIQNLLPAATPVKTIRIADTEQLFIEEMKRALLKPAFQSQNKGITFMSDNKLNARQIINKIGHRSSAALSGLLRELRDVQLK